MFVRFEYQHTETYMKCHSKLPCFCLMFAQVEDLGGCNRLYVLIFATFYFYSQQPTFPDTGQQKCDR